MRFLAIIGALAIIIALAAVVYFFGGFYSVAGTAQDPAIVASALVKVRLASISHHATELRPYRWMILPWCRRAPAPLPRAAASTAMGGRG